MAKGYLPVEFERVYPSKVRPATPWEARRAGSDYGVSDTPDWRSIDWQPYLHELRVSGRSVNYVDYGDGDGAPVVFVHGLGGNWQNWLENLPRVGECRRCIALDLPGFGRSAMPADRITISHYARIVDELCERLGIASAMVVGNSMGGFVGAEMAVSYSRRVESLVLAAAAGISVTTAYRLPTVTAARASTIAGVFGLARHPQVVVRPRLRHIALAPVVRHATLLRPDITYEVMQAATSPGYVPALDALLAYDFRDRLEEITCPTLLVWGAKDMLVPVKDADEFERQIPDTRKVILDDTGHAPMLERPVPFNRALLDFIGEDRPGGARVGTIGAAPPEADALSPSGRFRSMGNGSTDGAPMSRAATESGPAS
jgi:pimeloyl-ACP methyl ester carboxylesterase